MSTHFCSQLFPLSYTAAPKPAPCARFLGNCWDSCDEKLREPLGNDCGDKVCCVMSYAQRD